mmetsp:Transcript_16719/g.34919  ORF Transcript_16719/g.34919 Transcript_16719/m.34919 type:complete len:107 (-) Transcript_16719:111-431(-)
MFSPHHPCMIKSRIPRIRIRPMRIRHDSPIVYYLDSARDVTPGHDDFVFGAATSKALFAGGDGGGVAEDELKGDAAFGTADNFAGEFGAVAYFVGGVVDWVVEGGC